MDDGSKLRDAQWYVEEDGKKTGPWTAIDLLSGWRGGLVGPNAKATTAALGARAIPIAELEAFLRSEPQPQRATGTFTPPPRPLDLVKSVPTPAPPEAATDAATNLVDALQATRERKAAAVKTAPDSTDKTSTGLPWNIPPQAGLVGLLSIMLAFMIFGMAEFLKHRSPSIAQPQRSTIVTTTPVPGTPVPGTAVPPAPGIPNAPQPAARAQALTAAPAYGPNVMPPSRRVFPAGMNGPSAPDAQANQGQTDERDREYERERQEREAAIRDANPYNPESESGDIAGPTPASIAPPGQVPGMTPGAVIPAGGMTPVNPAAGFPPGYVPQGETYPQPLGPQTTTE